MLRKLGTLAFAVTLVVASAWGLWAQSGNSGTTHVVLTNDQDFLVSNDKYLSGVYECSDGGYIDFSCLTGHLPEVNCPDGFAIQTIGTGLAPVGCIEVGGGGGEPAGADTYIQYNNMGVFGADQNFTWDYTNSILTLGGAGPGTATFSGETLVNLPAGASDGTIAYCTDCTPGTDPCTDGGDGSMVERIDGAWICFGAGTGSGTVTSVALTMPGSIWSVGGSPVTTSGTLAVSLTATSGGIPYFSSTSAMGSSGLLTDDKFVLGGGAGAAPTSSAAGDDGTTITTGARDLSYAQSLFITGQRAISADDSFDAGDRIINCTSGSSTDKTYTLPAATGSGIVIDVFKVDSGTNHCLIEGDGADALNDGTTRTLDNQWDGDTCRDMASAQWQCRGSGITS